ncbi:MAG: hypothetical protein U0521_25245 [Anaerolineae bacterium]
MDGELRAPDCKVFVDAEISENELVSLTAPVIFAPDDGISLQVEVVRNEDYDSNRRRQFPDGFVYFRYTLDLFMSDATVARQAAIVTRLLKRLWEWGIPAVAACAYEERLPKRGGYRSRAVPWPL